MDTVQDTNVPENIRRRWNKGKLVGPKAPLTIYTTSDNMDSTAPDIAT
jgi:hypothetical protein